MYMVLCEREGKSVNGYIVSRVLNVVDTMREVYPVYSTAMKKYLQINI